MTTQEATDPSPSFESSSMPDEIHLGQIAQNWHLTDPQYDAIVPKALRPSFWTEPLLSAVHELSALSVGQKERAHNLLSTYFHARIREASYTGKQGNIYATLEVDDVEKAISSVRKMRRGQEMQSFKTETRMDETVVIGDSDEVRGKRKYSIRHDSPCENDETKQRPEKINRTLEPEVEMTPITSSILHTLAAANAKSDEELPQRSPLPQALRPILPKPRLRLPPIDTQAVPPPYTPSPYILLPQHHLVQAAQRATHEFNVQRLELAKAEAEYNAAVQRYVDAGRNMEDARRQIGECE